MTNMCNAHTLTIGGLNMILAVVGLLHGELVEVVGEVISCPRIRILVGVDGVGRSAATMMSHGESSQLSIHVPAVIASAEEVTLEALEATRRNVPDLAADLAGWTGTT